jgi:hypothetical protein
VNETPLQRAGVNSRYKDYLDALYPLDPQPELMKNVDAEHTRGNSSLKIEVVKAIKTPVFAGSREIVKNS